MLLAGEASTQLFVYLRIDRDGCISTRAKPQLHASKQTLPE